MSIPNCRILNRIVEINIANVRYADIELSGNTCFVGTNNFGKTSLQRAILFFYSANSLDWEYPHRKKVLKNIISGMKIRF